MKTDEYIGRLYTLMAGVILPTLSVHNQAVLNQLFLKFSRSEGDSFEYDSASLSQNARLTPVTLRSAIRTLQSRGLIEIIEQGSSHKPTKYRLIFSRQEGPGRLEQKQAEYAPATAVSVERTVKHLSFPYNWSNSNMSDEALIAGVLRKNRFKDVLGITAEYGLGKVSEMASNINEPDIRAAVERTLKRIRMGKEIAHGKLKT